MKNTFTCAKCGLKFKGLQSDKEAEAEMKANFGEDTKKEDCAVLCDDCYKEFMKWFNGGKE